MAKSFGSTKFLAGVAMGAMSVTAMSAPAMAQNAPAAAEEEDDDVILVIANKREQNLQDVPAAISALSSEQVELQGLSEAKDLSGLAPNLAVNGATTNATAAVITIRGIPTAADEAQGFDSPIGVYLDGVYLARSSASSFNVADIERVEVLRGPQGTLFGRNTTGGAVNFITKSPSDEASLRVKLGYGSYNQKQARVILNSGTIGDSTRITGGYAYSKRNGVVDNLLQPKDSLDPGGNETHSARLAVEIDITDNLKLTNVTDWTQIRGVPHANQLTEVGDGTFRPNVTIDGNTFAQVQPSNVAGFLANSTILEAGCGTPLSNVQRARLDPICLNDAGTSEDTIRGNMTRLELDLDTVTIRSTTAFRGWKNTITGSDLDGMGSLNGPLMAIGGPNPLALFSGMPASVLTNVGIPAATANFLVANAGPVPTITQPLFQATNQREQSQFSQELEIIGGSGTSFEWVLGGFYFKEKGSEVNPQRFGFVLDTNQAVYTTATAEATLLGFMFPAGAAAFLAPGFAADLRANNPEQFRVVPVNSTLAYSVKGESFAVYGQGTFRPGGEDGPLGITLGLRYTWDKKEVDRTQNGAAPIAGAEIALNQQSAKFNEPTGHVTIDYRASDAVNMYLRAARGYRSGGFNLRQSTSVANNIGLIPFNEEKITSYEYGIKTQLIDGLTINGAVFYNIYEDQQATVPIPIQGGGSFGTQVVNAGKTKYLGVEVEGRWKVTDNFTLDGSFGYVDTKTKEFPSADINGVIQNIASIHTPGNSPSTTANAGITYSQYLGGGDTRLTARVGWSYVSGVTFFGNPLTAPFQDSTRGDARGLVDAQLRLDGIKLGGDKSVSLQLWGKNILDKEYVTRGIDFGQLGFGSVIYGDPATYGLSLEFEF